jgi:hypothetical protein
VRPVRRDVANSLSTITLAVSPRPPRALGASEAAGLDVSGTVLKRRLVAGADDKDGVVV